MKRKFKVVPVGVRAAIDASTFDKAKRTVDVVIATDTTDVTMYDWYEDQKFIEQLVMSADAIRMDRINSGAPFLNDHDNYSGVLGSLGKVVENSVRIDGNKLRGTILFSDRDEVKPVLQDVQDGILKNISVGYRVFKYERQPVVDGETPIYRAIDWEPMEVSLVLVPADIEAGVGRSVDSNNKKQPREIEIDVVGERAENFNNSNTMNELQKRALAVGLPTTATEAEVHAAERRLALTRRALAVGLESDAEESDIVAKENEIAENKRKAAERAASDVEHKRVTEILSICRKFKMAAEVSDKLIADRTSIDESRKIVMDKLAAGDHKIDGSVTVTGDDEKDKKRTGIVAALALRSRAIDPKQISKEETELAKEYRHLSLLDLAKMHLEAERPGATRGLNKMEIAGRAISSHSTDFPILLEGTNRRILLAAYAATPDKWRLFSSIGSVGDFRDYKRLRPGSISRLDALQENGEYKLKALVDADSAKVNVSTFGNIITVSRKMIINDDLGAFTMLSRDLGRAAARSIEIDVFALLASNAGLGPNMQDGNTLFHATHNNIGTGAAISMASFNEMATIMASQKDRQGNDYLDINAAIWLGPKASEGLAKSINGSKFDPDAANKLQKPNIVEGMFNQTVGTPRLSGTRWYSFADPAEYPVFEVSFLDGQEAPYLESEQEFKNDGVSWKVRHDYGVAALDWVGAGTNAGA